MSQLSKQSIRRLCLTETPMIYPFMPSKLVIGGKSAGLSCASYDVRIAHDLLLGVNPALIIAKHYIEKRTELRASFALETAQRETTYEDDLLVLVRRLYDDDYALGELLKANPPMKALAHTIEDFHIPANVSAAVADKSSFARVFVSAFNTFFDPGFHGNATLELVNFGDEPVIYNAGDPVCQFIFSWLDEPTETPYGALGDKYQHQTKAAHPARYEATLPCVLDRCANPTQCLLEGACRRF